LFVSLSAGCCYKLTHLNLARNPFSHRKVREVTRSIQEFFSQSCELRYVGLSATKLPPQALRLLLQGLATNTRLFGLELDLSSCELCSAGAQVIQEHISEAKAIRSLDISDNSFENDMVTLVLSVGRCQSLHHLALGRNFAMKSRALTDLLHRIAQLIQDEECPLQSLSVSDSKLKTGMHILLSALGGHATLTELDISGNNIGDTGAKMLAKALMTNTMLRSLTWDRNNVTARGFQDVADALERNFTLQKMSPPLADITQSYRSNPEQTKEALSKIQQCLSRNNMRNPGSVELQQVFRSQQSEKMIQGMCRQLEDTLQRVSHCNTQAVQNDIMAAHEVLQNARESLKLLPSLCDESRKCSPDGDWVMDILSDAALVLTQEIKKDFQELGQDLMGYAETVCPKVVQRSSVCKSLSECISKRSKQAGIFLRSTLVETAGQIISTRLSELRQTLTVTLVESMIEQILQDLTEAQDKMDSLISENPSSGQRINIPELRLTDSDFPTDDYSPAFWRSSLLSKSLRPAASIKSKTKQLLATSDMGRLQRRRRLMEGELASVDTAEAVSGDSGASLSPPPSRPTIYSIPYKAPKQETADGGGLNGRRARFPGCSPSTGPHPGSGFSVSPMEPLPSQGQTLRHYTASRPRPRRTHTQPPTSRPQEPVSEEKKEDNEAMGRVDEGVEEFFAKKIIPDCAFRKHTMLLYQLKQQCVTKEVLNSKTSDIAKNLRSNYSFCCDINTVLITLWLYLPFLFHSRTLCRDKVNFYFMQSLITFDVCDVNVPVLKDSSFLKLTKYVVELIYGVFSDRKKAGFVSTSTDTSLPSINVHSLSSSTTFPSTTCSSTTTIPTKNIKKKFDVVRETVTPPESLSTTQSIITTPPEPEAPSYVERRHKVTKRLRENKSQSLILLTGIEPDDKDNTPNKKHASDGAPGFEQRLQVMLHRMGVSKTPPAETKMCQNKDEELRKATSEGAILNKPELPPKDIKSRIMSTSRELLYPKPALPECIMGPLPPKPSLAAKLPPPIPAARPSSAPAFTSSTEQVHLTAHRHDGRPMETEQLSPRKELHSSAPKSHREDSASDRNEKVQSVTEVLSESLPKLRQHLKPLPQRRAVSVHEEALTMTQELKAVLQKSPIRFRGNRWDLPSCKEDETH
uniref:CARMIL C-terminal domain-containing protein n=1 Tax=Poecilia formosa TaxID=48698 RepID=A0A087XAF4_POEFO